LELQLESHKTTPIFKSIAIPMMSENSERKPNWPIFNHFSRERQSRAHTLSMYIPLKLISDPSSSQSILLTPSVPELLFRASNRRYFGYSAF
jgi:hypothetical protein